VLLQFVQFGWSNHFSEYRDFTVQYLLLYVLVMDWAVDTTGLIITSVLVVGKKPNPWSTHPVADLASKLLVDGGPDLRRSHLASNSSNSVGGGDDCRAGGEWLATSFQQPGYLADLISPYSQSRLLRSSTQKLLSFPPHYLDTAARRFSVAAPRLWNSLPLNCRTAPSVNTFKIRLKTFLFDLV